MTKVLPAPDTELSLPALVELIHTLGISRLVLPETTENGIPAVRLCGLWRLRRTCRSDTLLVEQLHLETGAWTRLSTGEEKKILRHINVCGFCSSCFADQRMMGELRNLAFSYLLDGLTDRRIVLTGTVKTVLK